MNNKQIMVVLNCSPQEKINIESVYMELESRQRTAVPYKTAPDNKYQKEEGRSYDSTISQTLPG